MKGLPFQPFAAIRRQSKRLVAGIPWDLTGVVCFAAAATALIMVFEVSSSLVRAAVGIPLLFLAPGYVIVSVLFPRATAVRESATETRLSIRQSRELTDVERAALSFGMSFAILPLLGLAIITSPWALTGSVVAFFVTCFVAIGAVVATVRRLLVPASKRYRVGFQSRFAAARAALFGRESTLHVAVNVVLVLSMVLAVTAVGYGLVSPQQAEQYTDLQLLTENESGELVSSDYPENIEPGEAAPLVVALDNREGEAMNYTVVLQQQRVEDGDVVERTELQRFNVAVDDGETAQQEVMLRPTTTDGNVRISVMVFTDDVPETPTHDNAYRHGHIWTSTTADTAVGADTDLESGDGGNESAGGNDTDAADGTESGDGDGTNATDGNESDDASESDSDDDPFDFGDDDDDPFDFGDDTGGEEDGSGNESTGDGDTDDGSGNESDGDRGTDDSSDDGSSGDGDGSTDDGSDDGSSGDGSTDGGSDDGSGGDGSTDDGSDSDTTESDGSDDGSTDGGDEETSTETSDG